MHEPDEITFEVSGDPVPQPRVRVSTWGGRGRAYVPKEHPIHSYREAIVLVARTAGWTAGPTDGPVAVEILAWFKRPPSHLTKSGAPRASAPQWPGRADVDNVAKAVLDAITTSAAFWRDDDQVVELRVWKGYSELPRGRTIVSVRRLAP
jgi:Holliday junction resolvase RusA-like endonuclease